MTDEVSKTRIWVNVTTSTSWTRPAVGIIRVERALAEHLQERLGKDNCKLCTWKDDGFVEWVPDTGASSRALDRALDVLLPRGTSFELSRSYIGRALERLSINPGASRSERAVDLSIPLCDRDIPMPIAGDILISAGLDWNDQYSSRFFSLAKQQGLRIITCCYDLIPVLFPQYCVGDISKRFTEYFMDLTWGSEAVLCISEHSRRDYLKLCADMAAPERRTLVIPLGDNLPQGTPDISAHVAQIAAAPFILYVSTIERRKNHEVLYKAYHLLARRGLADDLPTLVFVGMPGWGVGDLLKDMELDPLTASKIVQLNHVTDGELAYLYTHARFCVYPSLYEGWGLPVGEALSMGKAIISSGEASLCEVAGDLVRYVPAWDPYAWADAIHEYASKPELVRAAERRVKAGYVPRKWQDTAEVISSLLGEMIAESDGGDKTREFSVGYDMSTECGMHCGPCIRTTGAGGTLTLGPHVSMPRGTYQLEVLGGVEAGHVGQFTFEVTSDHGKHRHFIGQFDAPPAAEERLAYCEFAVPGFTQDVEFRCIVEAGCALRLDKVRVCAQ